MTQQQKSAKNPKSMSGNKGFIPQQNPNKPFLTKGSIMTAPRVSKFSVGKRGNR